MDLINSIIKNVSPNPDIWIAIGTIFLGLVTFLTVLVALFQEKIKKSFTQARLKMEILLKRPHSHQIDLTHSVTGKFLSKSIYIRILISHLRGSSAEDVEIMIVNFWEIKPDGSKVIKKSFLPMNLVWSHFKPRRINLRIPKGLFRHCDLGRIQPSDSKSILVLDTMTQSNPVAGGEIPNVIKPGKYEFELWLSGLNTRIIKKRWRLEFDGQWTDNEDKMLKDHIHLAEVSCSEKISIL
jgi:hypothetical protein